MTDKEKELVDYTIKLVKAGWPDDFIWDRVKEKADCYEQKEANTADSYIRGLKSQYTGKN